MIINECTFTICRENIDFVLNKSDNGSRGYFLKAGMECPPEFHENQKDLAAAPEKIRVTEEMLSPEQIDIMETYDLKVGHTEKLVPNLLPKEKYVVHYRNLKYYLSIGWKLAKVYRILEFKQKPWLKKFTDFNTERRKEATNEADKNLFKLMNNSVYGKTM